MQSTTLNMLVMFIVGVVVVALIYGWYESVKQQQEPYQLSRTFNSTAATYKQLAKDPKVIDAGLSGSLASEECTADSGLAKCYEEFAEELEKSGLKTTPVTLYAARRINACRKMLDDVMTYCVQRPDAARCSVSKGDYEAECYQETATSSPA